LLDLPHIPFRRTAPESRIGGVAFIDTAISVKEPGISTYVYFLIEIGANPGYYYVASVAIN